MNSQNLLVKEYMRDALLLLMETQPFDAISVTDITKKAGVSRMAFYRNYEVKDDIIDEYFKEKLSGLVRHLHQEAHSHDENLMDFLHLLCSLRPILCILIASNAEYLIKKNFEVTLTYIIQDHYRRYHPSHIPSGYQMDFLVGGLLQVILSWARKDSDAQDSALEDLFLHLELFIQS